MVKDPVKRAAYFSAWRAKRKAAGLCTAHGTKMPNCVVCKEKGKQHQLKQQTRSDEDLARERMSRAIYDMRHKFGLSKESYEAMLARQSGGCAICGSSMPGTRNGKPLVRFSVDHDHETDQIRGLLCLNCNAGLGQFKDKPERIYAAYM